MKNTTINFRSAKHALTALVIVLFTSAGAYAATGTQVGKWALSASAETAHLVIKGSASAQARVTIADRLGNVVYTGELKKAVNVISTQQMSEGKYTVTIKDNEHAQIYKLDIL